MKTITRVAPVPAPHVVPTRTRRRVVLAAAVLVAAWLLGAVAALALTAKDARAGMREMDRVRSMPLADLGGPGLGRATAGLDDAARHFTSAASRSGGVLLTPIRVVPFFGWQVRAAHDLSAAAAIAAAAGSHALADARHALEAAGTAGGPERVTLLRTFSGIARRLSRQLDAVDLGRSDGLVWPVSSARRRAAHGLSSLRWDLGGTAAGAEAVADLLDGPSRYLVFAANNAEMRAGGGAFLRGGVLSARRGRLTMGTIVSTDDWHLPGDGVPVTGSFAKTWGWLYPNHEWHKLTPPVSSDPRGVSPRFEDSALLAAKMWTFRTHTAVDGVIAVDAPGLAAILRVTGPVSIAGRRIDTGNVVQYLTHDQYTGHVEFSERLERLGELTRVTMAALDRGHWDPIALASSVGGAARGRHLLVWSKRPGLESLWHRSGVAGGLAPDSMLVSVINRGGNKLDRFLHAAGAISTNDSKVRVSLTLTNTVPRGEPTYVAGPHPQSGVGEGVYIGVATLHVPGTAQDLTVTGAKLAVSGHDRGTAVAGAAVVVPRGRSLTIEFSFTLPPGAHALRVEPSGRVPAIDWTAGGKNFRDTSGHQVRLRAPRP